MSQTRAECIVRRSDTHAKEVLEVDNHRLAVYTKPGTTLNVSGGGSSNITKGDGVITDGSGLQQVLLYARKDNGELHPLECLSDRLLVDVLELNPSGPLNGSSAISQISINGYKEGTNLYRTMMVDNDGRQIVNNRPRRTIQIITNNSGGTALSGIITHGQYTENIVMTDYRHLHLCIASANVSNDLELWGASASNFTDGMKIADIPVDSANGGYIYAEPDVIPEYLRIYNNSGVDISFTGNIQAFQSC